MFLMKNWKKEVKMKFSATGVLPANVTAKGADDKVDIKQTKAVAEFLFSKGVDGLHVCGTTGECMTLTVDERKAVLEACLDVGGDRGTIIAQVGAVATRDVCELARHAAKAGADAVSSVPPFYYPANLDIVMNHYRRIAEASKLPVVIYDNPTTTGVTIDPDTARTLAEEDAVHGIKLARSNMYALARMAEINDGKFVVYPVETYYLAGLATAEVAGTIGSMGNWVPEAFVGIKRNFEAGNLKRAAQIQRLACELFNAYGGREEMACTKALVEYRGIPCGVPWEPLLPLSDAEKQEVYANIDKFNLDFDALAQAQ